MSAMVAEQCGETMETAEMLLGSAGSSAGLAWALSLAEDREACAVVAPWFWNPRRG
jgi:hypothetical protein